IISPNPIMAAMMDNLQMDAMAHQYRLTDDPPSSPLMTESAIEFLLADSKDSRIAWAPFLYIVANIPTGDSQQQVILAGTLLPRATQLAPWWKITKRPNSDLNEY